MALFARASFETPARRRAAVWITGLVVCAVLVLANRQDSRAQQPSGISWRPAPPATARPAAGANGDDDLYRCHLDEDTACTVVRQTAQGLVVLSYRSPGLADGASTWSVVIGTGTVGSRPAPPGTVMIVPPPPIVAAVPVGARAAPPPLPNGAPILD